MPAKIAGKTRDYEENQWPYVNVRKGDLSWLGFILLASCPINGFLNQQNFVGNMKALREGLGRAEQLLYLGDGAEWVWNLKQDRWKGGGGTAGFFPRQRTSMEFGTGFTW
jgi:hypothetical protein